MVSILLNCVSCTVENNGYAEIDSDIISQLSCLDYPTFYHFINRQPLHIGGYIVGKLLKSCEECSGALVTNVIPIGFLSFNTVQWQGREGTGGLIYPSADVLKILKWGEIVFRTNIFLNVYA